jgi:hypothetical protein
MNTQDNAQISQIVEWFRDLDVFEALRSPSNNLLSADQFFGCLQNGTVLLNVAERLWPMYLPSLSQIYKKSNSTESRCIDSYYYVQSQYPVQDHCLAFEAMRQFLGAAAIALKNVDEKTTLFDPLDIIMNRNHSQVLITH